MRRILATVNWGTVALFRTPRFPAIRRARERPPRRPRIPCRKAASTLCHVSPDASEMGPELALGHSPVRLRWASIQPRMMSSVNIGRFARFLTPRCFSKMAASEVPPSNPQAPYRRALSIFRQFIPSGASMERTEPVLVAGYFPTRLK